MILTVPSVILFAGDLILNIHNPAIDVIPVGTRIALALLSTAGVRNSGLSGVSVSLMTPAVQYVLDASRGACC